MNGTGIHGLAYVVPGKSPTFERLAWTFFILGAIGYASYQLNEAVVCKFKGGFKSEETGGFLLLQNKYSKSLS